MEFGERLAQIRKSKGISQEDLAEMLNVSRQSISKWERGEAQPELSNLAALCDALSVTPNELLGYENAFEPQDTQDIRDDASDSAQTEKEEKRRIPFREIAMMIAGAVSAGMGALTHLTVAVLSTMIRVRVLNKVVLEDGTTVYEGGSGIWGYDYTMFVKTYRLQAILFLATVLLVVGIVVMIRTRCRMKGITVRAWLAEWKSRFFRRK